MLSGLCEEKAPHYLSHRRSHLKSFMLVLFYTALVAVIPAIAIILYKQVFVYKKIVREVEQMDINLEKGGGNTGLINWN